MFTIDMLILMLWKLWKWILHLITGQCEVYRIAMATGPLAHKTTAIVSSLKLSRVKVLRDFVAQLGINVQVENAIDILIREKSIKQTFQQQFVDGVRPCLLRVSGVKQLWSEVEEMRAQSYQQSNQLHEAALLQLWNDLMVGQKLEARISKQWQDLGFQGNNPATDFRGMGMLGLQCLLYFSAEHNDQARKMLLHSQHPKYWYPFAVVGIDLTGVLYTWLKEGSLDVYLYSTSPTWPLQTSVFMAMFCYIFYKFDLFWTLKKPENVMAFPKVKSEFLELLKSDIDKQNVTLSLQS